MGAQHENQYRDRADQHEHGGFWDVTLPAPDEMPRRALELLWAEYQSTLRQVDEASGEARNRDPERPPTSHTHDGIEAQHLRTLSRLYLVLHHLVREDARLSPLQATVVRRVAVRLSLLNDLDDTRGAADFALLALPLATYINTCS
jgi:hypothetical protein